MGKHGISVLGCLIGYALVCSGQDLASIPYHQLLRIAKGDATQKPDAKSFKLLIASTKGVPPEKIQLSLQTKDGPTPLIVDDKGYFEVPHSKELLAENPLLIANQPRGTLNISFKMAAPPFKAPKIPKNGIIKYKDLFQPLIDVQNVVRKVDPTFGLMGKDQFALMIKTNKPIKVKRPLGVRSYRPDDDGLILLIMEAFYFEENADVEITGDLAKIEMQLKPVSAADAAKIKAKW